MGGAAAVVASIATPVSGPPEVGRSVSDPNHWRIAPGDGAAVAASLSDLPLRQQAFFAGVAVLAGLFVLGGVLSILSGVRSLYRGASVYLSDPLPLRAVPGADGLVEFEGRVRPRADEAPIEAPISGEDCVYYELRVRQRRQSNANSDTDPAFALAERGEVRRPFVVQEGGRRIEVDPEGAEFDLWTQIGEVVETVRGGHLPEEARDRLAAFDVDRIEGIDAASDVAAGGTDKVRQYRERRLDVDDTAHVVGAEVVERGGGWDDDADAVVGAPDGDEFRVTAGAESAAVGNDLKRFFGAVVFGVLLVGVGMGIGLRILGPLF